MAKDYNVLAKSIVELVGGEENVVSLAHGAADKSGEGEIQEFASEFQ